jgi:hypothetical protein
MKAASSKFDDGKMKRLKARGYGINPLYLFFAGLPG